MPRGSVSKPASSSSSSLPSGRGKEEEEPRGSGRPKRFVTLRLLQAAAHTCGSGGEPESAAKELATMREQLSALKQENREMKVVRLPSTLNHHSLCVRLPSSSVSESARRSVFHLFLQTISELEGDKDDLQTQLDMLAAKSD